MTKKTTNIIVVLALVLVLVIGIVVALIMSNNSKEHIDREGSFEFSRKGSEVKIIGYTDAENVTEVEIPKTLGGFKVTAIGENAFKGNSKITKVTMLENITSIGESAFEDCSKLNTVKMNAVTEIGKAAFKNAKALSYVDMIPSLVSIGDEAFAGCDTFTAFHYNLKDDFTIDSTLSSVGKDAFKGSQLNKILIPSSFKTIGEGAFRGANLSQIFFYEGVENIGVEAFQYDKHNNRNMLIYSYNSELETDKPAIIDNLSAKFNDNSFPKSLKTIGDRAFKKIEDGYSHLNLNTITFGENLVSIGDEAFVGASIYNVSFENPDTTLGKYAFSRLYTQTEVHLPANIKVINDGLFYGTNLKSGRNMEIPASVESIGVAAFSGSAIRYEITFAKDSIADQKYQFMKSSTFCGLLSKDGKILYSVIMGSGDKKFLIPDTVESIEPYAFARTASYDPDTTSVTIVIPETVKEVKENAFTDSNITVVKFNHLDANPIKLSVNAFKNHESTREYTVLTRSNTALYNTFNELFKNTSNVSVNTFA